MCVILRFFTFNFSSARVLKDSSPLTFLPVQKWTRKAMKTLKKPCLKYFGRYYFFGSLHCRKKAITLWSLGHFGASVEGKCERKEDLRLKRRPRITFWNKYAAKSIKVNNRRWKGKGRWWKLAHFERIFLQIRNLLYLLHWSCLRWEIKPV